ncbi:SLAF9 protein, partial [Atractosteus spatula]|nr:SLAF9 protein [Atractosteus spatula]
TETRKNASLRIAKAGKLHSLPKKLGPRYSTLVPSGFSLGSLGSRITFHLVLPPTFRIHLPFHVSLLRPFHRSPLVDLKHRPPPPHLIRGVAQHHCLPTSPRLLVLPVLPPGCQGGEIIVLYFATQQAGAHLSAALQQELKGIVGRSVTFEAQVSEDADLKQIDIGGPRTVAGVMNATIYHIDAKFRGRVTWEEKSGFFQIKDLKTSDSGVYTVQNLGGQKNSTTFNLTVYNKVSKPQVNRGIRVSENCSLLCSVSNGRKVTLSWQREGETLNHTSNPDLNTTLTLPLETEGLSHSYSCVASNPVSNETLPVRPEDHCFDRVPKPQVSRVSQVSESCSLLCSVSNGREVTLSWQREGETLSNTSNPDLNTPLTLPLETEGLSHSYSCVASNPVSTETLPVRPEEHCFGADDRILLYAGAAGGGAVCLGIVALMLYCRLRGKKPRDEDSSPTNNGALESGPAEVTYAALDMKRLKKPTAVPLAGEDHTVYAEVTGGGRMQGSHFAPEPPPAAGTLASECTEYARVNFRRKTRRAQDPVLCY